MRTTRIEWRRQNARPRKISRRDAIQEHAARLRREIRKAVIPDPSALPGKYEWQITVPLARGEAIECIDIANTKSEVRARIKSALGFVPQETVIEKTGREPRKEFIQARIKELYEQSQPGTADPDQSPCDAEAENRDVQFAGSV